MTSIQNIQNMDRRRNRRCFIEGCTDYKKEGTSFHKLTAENAEKWCFMIETINNQKNAYTYNENSLVCGWHFSQHHKISIGRFVRLTQNAVPTLFKGCDDNVVNNFTIDSSSDSITIVKSEPFDDDMGDTNESTSFFCVTESSDCSSSQPFPIKQEVDCTMDDASGTRRLYKCEECGHLNTITPSLEDGFFDGSQSIGNAQGTSSVFHVSINPGSSGLNSSPFPTQSNDTSGDRRSTRNNKRLAYPGDVVDDDELGEESAQKYISVLRKTVMDQRKQTKRLTQQNRRSQKRVNKLKSLLKELIEKTKNGNYVIES